MDSLELMSLFEHIKSDENLTNRQKKVRLSIINATLAKNNREQGYLENAEKYKKAGYALEKVSNGKFVLSEDIDLAEEELENFVMSSDIIQYMKRNQMINLNYEDLLEISKKLELDDDMLPIAYELYKTIEIMKKAEDNKIAIIESVLVEILGFNLISKFNHTCIIDGEIGHIERKLKTLQQLESDHTKALSLIEDGTLALGLTITDLAKDLIDELFHHYKKGYTKIKLTDERQIRA